MRQRSRLRCRLPSPCRRPERFRAARQDRRSVRRSRTRWSWQSRTHRCRRRWSTSPPWRATSGTVSSAASRPTRPPRSRSAPWATPRRRRTVVAMGDSHIGQWLATLDILGERRGFKVIPLIKLSCAPYDVKHAIVEVDGEYTQCTDFRRWARRRIARWRPVAVVLAARVLAAGSDETTLEERAADWEQGVESGVRRLLRNGAHSVKVLSDLPEVDQDPGNVPATAGRDDGVLRVVARPSGHARATRSSEMPPWRAARPTSTWCRSSAFATSVPPSWVGSSPSATTTTSRSRGRRLSPGSLVGGWACPDDPRPHD